MGYTKAARARSWDRFALPLPGSTLTSVIGEPIFVPADLAREALEQYRQRAEDALLAVTGVAERWALELAAGVHRPDPGRLYHEKPPSGEQVPIGA